MILIAEQCNLALQVVGNTSTDSIAKIISCPSAKDIIDPEIQTIPKQFQTKAGSEPKISQDRIDELFKKIESSYADNIFDSNCTSQVIDLYSSELSWLKRCNEMLTNKVDALSKEVRVVSIKLNLHITFVNYLLFLIRLALDNAQRSWPP